MKLEAGKYYRTRDRRKAYVAAVGNPFDQADAYPVIGWIDTCGDATWTPDGTFNVGRHNSDSDLIALWIDPPWDYDPQPGDNVWVWKENWQRVGWDVGLEKNIDASCTEKAKESGCLFAKADVPKPPGGTP